MIEFVFLYLPCIAHHRTSEKNQFCNNNNCNNNLSLLHKKSHFFTIGVAIILSEILYRITWGGEDRNAEEMIPVRQKKMWNWTLKNQIFNLQIYAEDKRKIK